MLHMTPHGTDGDHVIHQDIPPATIVYFEDTSFEGDFFQVYLFNENQLH